MTSRSCIIKIKLAVIINFSYEFFHVSVVLVKLVMCFINRRLCGQVHYQKTAGNFVFRLSIYRAEKYGS